MKRKARQTRKERRKVKAARVYPSKYLFAVEEAKKHFPDAQVTGEVLEDGAGFGIQVMVGSHRHLIRLRATLEVNGRRVVSDFLEEPEESRPARLKEAFAAVEKVIANTRSA